MNKSEIVYNWPTIYLPMDIFQLTDNFANVPFVQNTWSGHSIYCWEMILVSIEECVHALNQDVEKYTNVNEERFITAAFNSKN